MSPTKIEWTGETWNPTTGCDRVSPGCDNCLAPATRVLHTDMTWRRIDQSRVGDQLVAFSDTLPIGANRVWQEAIVEVVWHTRAPAIKMRAGDRTIVAGAQHRFLNRSRPYWREAQNVHLQSVLMGFGNPNTLTEPESAAYQMGYIAGATVGDGTFRPPSGAAYRKQQWYWRISEPAFDRPLLDRLVHCFSSFGFDLVVQRFDPGPRNDPRFAPLSGVSEPMMKLETRRAEILEWIAGEALSPRPDDPQWMAGWLAGMFDTDGCYSGANLRISQTKPNGAIEAAVSYAESLGFVMKHERYKDVNNAILVGSIEDRVNFLGRIRPALSRKCADFYGRRTETQKLSVGHLESVGDLELIDIQTSTGTFIAEGLLTHNCYAMTLAKRLKGMGQAKYQRDGDPKTSGPGFGLTVHPDALDIPLRRNKPTTWFVDSMSDLFHPDVPLDFILHVWETMMASPQHIFQILTKRPQRMARIVDSIAWDRDDMDSPWRAYPWPGPQAGVDHNTGEPFEWHPTEDDLDGGGEECLPGVWLGTSIESDRYAFRADHLRKTPAAVRFLSLEPLLGPLLCNGEGISPCLDLEGIDWVIVGAESGRGARPMDLDWVREIRDACVARGIPFFFKQAATDGGRKIPLPELDGKVWDEMPARAG